MDDIAKAEGLGIRLLRLDSNGVTSPDGTTRQDRDSGGLSESQVAGSNGTSELQANTSYGSSTHKKSSSDGISNLEILSEAASMPQLAMKPEVSTTAGAAPITAALPKSSGDNSALSRLGDGNVPGQTNEHSSLFFLSLIEDHCRSAALKNLNAGTQNTFTINDEPVRELAERIFGVIAPKLSEAGFLPPAARDLTSAQFGGTRSDYLGLFENVLSHTASQLVPTGSDVDPELLDSLTSTSSPSRSHISVSNPPSAMAHHKGGAETSPQSSPPTPVLFKSLPVNGVYRSEYQDSFQEKGLLGHGAFGTVYVVKHHLDLQTYAVKKVVVTAQKLHEVGSKQVIAEVRALARYKHPNIAQYLHSWIEPTPPQSQATRAAIDSGDIYDGGVPKMKTRDLAGQGLDMQNDPSEESHFAIEFGYSTSETRESDGVHLTGNQDLAIQDIPMNSGPAIEFGYSTTEGQSNPSTDDKDEDTDDEIDEGKNKNQDEDKDKDLDFQVTPYRPIQSWTIYMKMALYPLTLDQLLSPDTPSPSGLQLRHCYHVGPSAIILGAILNGIEYLHSEKVVHRDLKPANIFFEFHRIRPTNVLPGGYLDLSSCKTDHCGSSGDRVGYLVPCIGDFGLVTTIKSPDALVRVGRYPHKSKQVGTPAYYPPKSPMSQPICPKLDVYSLGIIAIELIAKFNTKSERGAVLKCLREDGKLPKELEGHAMAEGIMSMTRTDVDERWGVDAVRAWLDGVIKKSCP